MDKPVPRTIKNSELLPLLKIALVLVRLDHVASVIDVFKKLGE